MCIHVHVGVVIDSQVIVLIYNLNVEVIVIVIVIDLSSMFIYSKASRKMLEGNIFKQKGAVFEKLMNIKT